MRIERDELNTVRQHFTLINLIWISWIFWGCNADWQLGPDFYNVFLRFSTAYVRQLQAPQASSINIKFITTLKVKLNTGDIKRDCIRLVLFCRHTNLHGLILYHTRFYAFLLSLFWVHKGLEEGTSISSKPHTLPRIRISSSGYIKDNIWHLHVIKDVMAIIL